MNPVDRPALEVAVVIEREARPNRWQDWRFRITEVLLHEAAYGSEPRLLRDDGKFARWLHPGFRLELNQVLDLDDRPIRWSLDELRPMIESWMPSIDHFYPGYRLWRSPRVFYRPRPQSPPFDTTQGPARTADTPGMLPWKRDPQGDPGHAGR